jgi:hypothetical protein
VPTSSATRRPAQALTPPAPTCSHRTSCQTTLCFAHGRDLASAATETSPEAMQSIITLPMSESMRTSFNWRGTRSRHGGFRAAGNYQSIEGLRERSGVWSLVYRARSARCSDSCPVRPCQTRRYFYRALFGSRKPFGFRWFASASNFVSCTGPT